MPGWKFDEGFWLAEDDTNRAFTLPPVSDLDLSGIPESFYKSGIVEDKALDFEEINFQDEVNIAHWTPFVKRGGYYVFNRDDYLHSSDSILLITDPSWDPDTLVYTNITGGLIDDKSKRSRTELDHQPHPLIPASIQYLTRDSTTFAIKPGEKFNKVSKFTGLCSNGIESDGDIYQSTDQSLNEFKIVKNDDDVEYGLPILEDENFVISTVGGKTIGTLTLDTAPHSGFIPSFSRRDIFRRELPFSQWFQKLADPEASLEDGDYAIGYKDGPGAGVGVKVYLGAETYSNYGTITYKPNGPCYILFNKDVRISYGDPDMVEIGIGIDDEDGQIVFLPHFPAYDLSTFEDGELVGEVILDTTSLVLTVDDVPWTRVASLADVTQLDDQNVYEFNPLWGEIKFGNAGNPASAPVFGARPSGVIKAQWTAVPLIRYDVLDSTDLFKDDTADLDPLVNALKRGFLCLDNRKLVPWKIELTTSAPYRRRADDSIVHGRMINDIVEGLNIPPVSSLDIAPIRARVIARGRPPQGVPNIPVEFISVDGLMTFTQSSAVTDGDGYAYSEVFGKSNYQEFVARVHFWEALESSDDPNRWNPAKGSLLPAFDPDGFDPIIRDGDGPPVIAAVWAGDGAEWNHSVLIVNERIEDDPEDILVFKVSVPGATVIEDIDDDAAMDPDLYPDPYDGVTRKGGLAKIWTVNIDGAEQVIHPIAVEIIDGNRSKLFFDRELPLPLTDNKPNLLMGFQVVIDRTARIEAWTVESPILVSNQLEFELALNNTMRDQWKLPNLIGDDADGFHLEDPEAENTEASRIGTATFLSPNDIQVTGFKNEFDGDINSAAVGDTVQIVGTSFPTTEELRVSVYMIKANDIGGIESLKDISDSVSFESSTRIKIQSLPSPPGDVVPGTYHIAVAGFHPGTDTPDTRRTSKPLLITA